jgi:hypothetical protein
MSLPKRLYADVNNMRGFMIGLITTALLGCVGPFSEDFESQYPDVNAARADGAFDRGWLPKIVPDDSIDIREMHNIDTNITWGCFVIPSGTEEVRRKLKSLGAKQAPGPVGSGPRSLFRVRAWWPQSMATTTVAIYRFDEAGARFTVSVGLDAEQKTACFHRTIRAT